MLNGVLYTQKKSCATLKGNTLKYDFNNISVFTDSANILELFHIKKDVL